MLCTGLIIVVKQQLVRVLYSKKLNSNFLIISIDSEIFSIILARIDSYIISKNRNFYKKKRKFDASIRAMFLLNR